MMNSKFVQPIKKGTFVSMYVGEIINTEEAERRGEFYDCSGITYLFDLDFECQDNPYTVDAAYIGNISHFMNHSCRPNLAVFGCFVNCLDKDLPKLALFAERDIEKVDMRHSTFP
jgi:histone-lysine N-methyltransferase SUV39H